MLSAIDAALAISRIPVEVKFGGEADGKLHALGIAFRFDDSLVGYIVVETYEDSPRPAKHDLVSLLEELRMIVDHIGDGLLVLNRDETIRYAAHPLLISSGFRRRASDTPEPTSSISS